MSDIKKKFSFFQKGFLFTLFLILIFNFYYSLPPKEEIQVMIHNPFLSYPLRERLKMGSPFYEYLKFVKKNTPKDATIILPPQESSWDLYGNFFYMQYYLYPRTLLASSGQETVLENADYALLVEGKDEIWPSSLILKGLNIQYLQASPKLGIIKIKR